MPPVLFVLAGVNGAGKSSIGGAVVRGHGLNYFNPDEAAAKIRQLLDCSEQEASVHAWQEGRRRLEAAIRERTNYAFETTLGGIGLDVCVWFVGLSTPEQHIARVRSRVAAGGHDIAEAKIRERWDGSRRNLIALMPRLRELKVFDNSEERDPVRGLTPPMKLVLHRKDASIIEPAVAALELTPEWAKAIEARAIQLQRTAGA